MIEVFKTEVCHQSVANQLVLAIEKKFSGYKANFDLEDCDHILRIQSAVGAVKSAAIISFLNQSGYDAALLPDEINMEQKSHRRICDVPDPEEIINAARSNYRNICLHLRRICVN